MEFWDISWLRASSPLLCLFLRVMNWEAHIENPEWWQTWFTQLLKRLTLLTLMSLCYFNSQLQWRSQKSFVIFLKVFGFCLGGSDRNLVTLNKHKCTFFSLPDPVILVSRLVDQHNRWKYSTSVPMLSTQRPCSKPTELLKSLASNKGLDTFPLGISLVMLSFSHQPCTT